MKPRIHLPHAAAGKAAGVPGCGFHFDLFRTSGLALGDMHFEHAVVKFRVHLIGGRVIRQLKLP